MKRSYLKLIKNKFFTTMVFASLLLTTTPFKSNAVFKNTTIGDSEQTTVQLVEKTDSSVMFNINLDNPNADKFTVVILNDDGEILFIKNYSDKNFNQQVTLPSNASSKRYIFHIWSSNKNLANNYVVVPEKSPLQEIILSVQ